GVAFAGDLAFWHKSIEFTSVANSTLLANLASIFVTLAAWLLWRERPRPLFLVSLALALGGVALLVQTSLDFSRTALLGDALGVVTAWFYAWYILAVKGLRDRDAAGDGGDEHPHRADPLSGGARLRRADAARERLRLVDPDRAGARLAGRRAGPDRLRARAPAGAVLFGGVAAAAGRGGVLRLGS